MDFALRPSQLGNMTKTRKRPETPPGVRADLYIALATATKSVGRLMQLVRALPDADECHMLRHEVNLIALRLANLETLALRWKD